MAPAADGGKSRIRRIEPGAWLALVPITATFGYYALPHRLQDQTVIQFTPQLLAYGSLAVWAAYHRDPLSRLGLAAARLPDAIGRGLLTGLSLGGLNTWVILAVVPWLGYEIGFLKDTPHGRVPVFLMVPWLIGGIAFCVEVNFRGFLLGRLAHLERLLWSAAPSRTDAPLALMISALAFSFDPFMVNTFRYLHWLAVWDGVVWGLILLRSGNLWIPIIAHATEVLVMYMAIRAALN